MEGLGEVKNNLLRLFTRCVKKMLDNPAIMLRQTSEDEDTKLRDFLSELSTIVQ